MNASQSHPSSKPAAEPAASPSAGRPAGQRGDYQDLISRCPVLKEAQSFSGSAQELARRARKLRRSLKLCARCNLADSCGLIGEVHWQIQIAIREVAEELGLS